MAIVTVLVVWLQTRWLLASIAYASGTRSEIAGRTAQAYQSFQRSRVLVPWLALPAEAAAYTGLRLAGSETDAARRLAFLRASDAALADVRRHAATGAAYWTLSAQVAFAQVRAGERSKLGASLDAFDQAVRLRPWDRQLLTQRAWALLEAGDPAHARVMAETALAGWEGGEAWLAWAVLARAARELGDGAAAERAAATARSQAPPQSRRALESLGLGR
jgi:hypothetical protein